MKDWIPLFQTLVWPVFLGVLAFVYRNWFQDILAIIKKRIKEGSDFNVGPSGFGMGTAPKLPEKEDNLSMIALALAMPKEKEPEDVGRAKDLIAKYVANYAIPASTAVQETVRKSAYIIKDSDPNSPLSHFAWVGVLDGGNPKTAEWQGLSDPDIYRNVPISVIEKQLLKNTVNYRKAVHTLNRVIKTLGTDAEVLKAHGFLSELKQWLPLHEQLKQQFADLKTTPQLKILKSVDTSTYFDDPKYPDKLFEKAIQDA
jgi:hypothetical protein